MKPALVALLLLASLSPARVAAQQKETPPAGTIQTEPIRQLKPDIDLWPLIAHPANAEAEKINAMLAHANQALRTEVNDCQTGKYAWSTTLDGKQKPPNTNDYDFSQQVRITMSGPRFLSLVADKGWYCGGAHPDGETLAFVFDLTTGSPVNWLDMLPPGGTISSDTFGNGSQANAVVLPALDRINLAQADAECKDAYQSSQPFLLWPDAKKNALIIFPFGLAHADIPCANQVDISIEQARTLGFSDVLLKAIDDAHRRLSAAH